MMSVNQEQYKKIIVDLESRGVSLVAVSKTKPANEILELYQLGHRDFGENYVQELVDKQSQLPPDIKWHFIGHLQSNKAKYIIPFVHLIQGIDSFKLLKEIDKQAGKISRTIDVLLQVHIAEEETKFGLDETELEQVITSAADLKHVRIRGLMGMASFTENMDQVRSEFRFLKSLFDREAYWDLLSMGMSADYETAIQEGSNMVRIGSLLFGSRP